MTNTKHDNAGKFVQQAAGAFMTIKCTVKRWDGVARLKHGAAEAAVQAHADPAIFNGYVKLMGKHHADLKRVKALYVKVYTFLDTHTLPFERGVYLVPVTQVPEVLAELHKLKQAADKARDEFLQEYDRLVAIARSESMGDWEREVRSKYPDSDEVKARFGITIKPPQPLPVADVSHLNLPASMAADIAAANADLISTQLESAKAAAFEAASAHSDRLVKQLRDGKRFHASLIEDTRRIARMLRDMTQGYDNDPRVIALADLLDDKVSSAGTVETWKAVPSARAESLRAAETVQKGLDDLSKAAAAATAADTSEADGEAVIGGMLADLLD